MLEYFANTADEGLAVGGTESNEQDSVMRSWSKQAKVGEVEILRDQKSLVSLRCFPNVAVASATEVLFSNGVNVVVETR